MVSKRISGDMPQHRPVHPAVKMARTIKCLPDQAKCNAENIEAVRVSPFDLHKVAEPVVVLQERPAKESDTDHPRKKPNGGKIYIKGEDIRVYG